MIVARYEVPGTCSRSDTVPVGTADLRDSETFSALPAGAGPFLNRFQAVRTWRLSFSPFLLRPTDYGGQAGTNTFAPRLSPSTTINARCVGRAIRSADRSRMKSAATIASAIVVAAVASGRIGAVIAASAITIAAGTGAAAGVRVSVASGSRGGTRM
jgi:hypothetical protein